MAQWKITALAGLLMLVATLVAAGLYSLLGEAAEYVLAALPVVIGVWLVLREANKRIAEDEPR